MGRKCCAPKCRSGYKGKSKDGISMHKFRAEWKSNFPRGDWKVTDQTFICSKHFTASNFITERRDSNTTRSTKKKDTELKYRFLKDDAYPTIHPNCPQYLSQKKPASRPSLAMSFYVKNGFPQLQETLNFLNLISKWRRLLNVKSLSKGTRKRDPDSKPITVSNIVNLEFLNKFASWLEEWMSSGKNGLSKQTFLACLQTSKTFPLLVEYLLKEKELKYILSGNIQSDPLEKRFGRYRQYSGANYFGSQKQFLEAEKAIRVKSLIKFSNYSMKEVCQIMGKDEKKIDSEVEIYSEMLVDMMCSKENAAYLSGIGKNVIYYVAGFIARSV